MLYNCVYYRMLLFFPCKLECKNLIREPFLDENNAVMTWSDHAKALKA